MRDEEIVKIARKALLEELTSATIYYSLSKK